MSAHTPGPWTVVAAEFPRAGDEDMSGCVAFWVRMPHQVICKADSDLIAAAPDLLAAAVEMLAQADSYHDEIGHDDETAVLHGTCDGICDARAALRAAIAKAEGRS